MLHLKCLKYLAVFTFTPWGMLETGNSYLYTTPLASTHCPRRYRCCQAILDCSYLVKWDVQSFLYEPKLRISQWTRRPQIYSSFATSPGLSVVKNSNCSYLDKWNLPSFLYGPGWATDNGLDEWDSKQHIIILKSCITKCWYQSQMLARAPLRPCLCLLVSLLSNNSL